LWPISKAQRNITGIPTRAKNEKFLGEYEVRDIFNSSTGRVLYGGNYILGRSGKLVVAVVLQMPSDPTL
jgi:hypothetical protein